MIQAYSLLGTFLFTPKFLTVSHFFPGWIQNHGTNLYNFLCFLFLFPGGGDGGGERGNKTRVYFSAEMI